MKEIFYEITMNTKNGKTLHLATDIGNSCKWVFGRQDSIWFSSIAEAQKFAKRYFKNFKNYNIKEFCYFI